MPAKVLNDDVRAEIVKLKATVLHFVHVVTVQDNQLRATLAQYEAALQRIAERTCDIGGVLECLAIRDERGKDLRCNSCIARASITTANALLEPKA